MNVHLSEADRDISIPPLAIPGVEGLPTVLLKHSKTWISPDGDRWADTFDIIDDDNRLGLAQINWLPEDKESRIANIGLIKPKRGQGFGTVAYLMLAAHSKEQGYVLRNDPDEISESAIKVWERFVAAGVATCLMPPYIDPPYPMTAYYRFNYTVSA